MVVIEGVLICQPALQVKLESLGQLRGRGINNTIGPARERERERGREIRSRKRARGKKVEKSERQ